MQYLEPEIVTLTQYIWSATLGLDAEPTPAPSSAEGSHSLDGLITVSGAWQGTVVLQVSDGAAAQAARKMFDLPDDATASLYEKQDAVAELTNMTGGNIKALMDGQCFLSLPAVVDGCDYRVRVSGGEVVTQVPFTVDGHAVVVNLLVNRARQ